VLFYLIEIHREKPIDAADQCCYQAHFSLPVIPAEAGIQKTDPAIEIITDWTHRRN
jgi:hypothetical protein